MPQNTQEIQKLEASGLVSLYTLDATKVAGAGAIFNFTNTMNGLVSLVYRGITFTPLDVQFDGFEMSGVGALPRPTMTLSNTDGIIQALVNTWGDLNGCTITRLRTFTRFLDGQPEADVTAFFGPDVYEVDRKTSDTSTQVVWELSASIDQEGRKIGRPVIRDTCLWSYRRWNTVSGSFEYTNVQCPYTGSSYYDINDNVVGSPALDEPSRKLSCCKTRFGARNPLPFGGFPGVSRTI